MAISMFQLLKLMYYMVRNMGGKKPAINAVSDDVQWLRNQFPKWQTINSIGVAESARDTGGEAKTERRYFVSSLGADESCLPMPYGSTGG